MMAAVFAPPRAARACGGGVVTSTAQVGSIGGNAQRIFVSVHAGMTDVITQIGVPATTADYGVLIPVPGQPTLDPNPIMSAELATLDARTQPIITEQSDDSGCGCAPGGGSTKGGTNGAPGGAQVSTPVTIGPVTAVTLTADTGDAINAWLTQNGFAIPAASQSIVDAYAGTGRYFIAIRRSDTATTGGPTSVGVHFTLAGDNRGFPLRFVSLGAAASVGLTVFMVADDVVAPSAPFAALTLNDLDLISLRTSGYAAALSTAIAQHGNHAFVIEGVWTSAELANAPIPSIQPFIGSTQTLTRLSAILPASALDTDVTFDQPFAGAVPRVRVVERTRASGEKSRPSYGFAMLAFAAVVGVRRRRLR
jgi:Uncharacterized protein conserved in bacteria (DUF2330)